MSVLKCAAYKAIFEKYKGGFTPPAAALERDIVGLGVAEKQTGRARQVFERSAEQAGYHEHGKNRLVMPGIAARALDVGQDQEADSADENGGRQAASAASASERTDAPSIYRRTAENTS